MRYRYFTLPSSRNLRQSRLPNPFDRYLHHHCLWQFSRRTVVGGLAAGPFGGLLLPLGRIGLASIAAIVFRVSLPVAAPSAIVTNPLTVGPFYYAAYKIGNLLRGSAGVDAPDKNVAAQQDEVISHGMHLVEWMQGVGLPLVLGLGVFALGSVLAPRRGCKGRLKPSSSPL